ncbi:MAG TPA: Smr/MutS family protein, partial [Victivallales bacterium]|nr:Smr/MutS family protein [Victivallales bacterium]
YSQFDKIIDLHGLTSSNAERIIKAIISNYPNQRVLINHGKGEGTLRQLVRKICKNDQRVKAVKNGEESLIPGGEGVTIIQL